MNNNAAIKTPIGLDDILTACELVESQAVDTIITAERLHPIVDSEITDESIAILKYSARTMLSSLSIILDQNRLIVDLAKGVVPPTVLFGRSQRGVDAGSVSNALSDLEKAKQQAHDLTERVLEWLPFAQTGSNCITGAAAQLDSMSCHGQSGELSSKLRSDAEMLTGGSATLAADAQLALVQLLDHLKTATATLIEAQKAVTP